MAEWGKAKNEIDRLHAKCDDLEGRMDESDKDRAERIAAQREHFGFATGSPGTKANATFERRKGEPDKPKGNKVTQGLLKGWRG